MGQLPPILPGTWRRSGRWLLVDRKLAEKQDIIAINPSDTGLTCPDCLSDEAVILGLKHPHFAGMNYCSACGLVWASYPARCPSCPGGWREAGFVAYSDSGKLICDKCKAEWEEEIIRECNEEEDFDLGNDL